MHKMLGVRLVLISLLKCIVQFMSRLQNSEPQHSGSISSGLQLLSASLHRNSSDARHWKGHCFLQCPLAKVFFSLWAVKRPKFGSCCGTNLEFFACELYGPVCRRSR